MFKRYMFIISLILALTLSIGLVAASAQQVVPGATADERAINGAKAYMQKNGLKSLKLNFLISTLFSTAVKREEPNFEKETGIGIGNYMEVGILDLGAKILAEAVGKSGTYDINMGATFDLPDGAASGVLWALDDMMKVGKPDVELWLPGLLEQVQFKGKTYAFFADGDHFAFIMRKDWLDKADEAKKFREKYGWGPGCPPTWKHWEQLAEFYTRDLDGDGRMDFFGAMGYRSRRYAWRWWLGRYYSKGKAPFDDQMHPTVDSPEGIETTKQYISITKYMPTDIQGWATAQAYPFYAAGHVFSFYTFPSATLAAEDPAKSKVRGKNIACLIPGSMVKGKLIRRTLQSWGNTYMINSYSKHREAGYWFIQWLNSQKVATRMVSFPKSVYDPFMVTQFTDPNVINARGKSFLDAQLKNAQVMVPIILLEGAAEYHDALDLNISAALNEEITPEEAMKRTAKQWEEITGRIGRDEQIKAWQSLMKGMPTKDVPD